MQSPRNRKIGVEAKKNGVEVIDKITSLPYGKFVHILDPEGNAIELWEPKEAFLIRWQFQQKIKKQAISRILSCLIINLDDALLHRSIRLPSNLSAQPLMLVYMAFHRIEFT